MMINQAQRSARLRELLLIARPGAISKSTDSQALLGLHHRTLHG